MSLAATWRRGADKMRSTSALTAMRRFIEASIETPAEVRLYIGEHLVELAHDLGVTTEVVNRTLAVCDDAALAATMLDIVKKVQATQRTDRRQGRARAAQAAADTLASRATWEGERVEIDLPALLSTALTKRADLLVFTSEDFTVSVYQGPLLDLKKVKRGNLTAFLDSEGLHVRWKTGGLNFRSRLDPSADGIVINLSRTAGAVAA